MIKHKSLQANTYKYWDKAHEKDPENYEYAKLIIYAPDEADLHEITLTYINTLNYNGAWDFEIDHDDNNHKNIVTFKYNGTITALNAAQKLHFHTIHEISWEWNIDYNNGKPQD